MGLIVNIFYVDECPEAAARSLIDIHVNKMIVESAQLLANCYSIDELEKAPRTQTGNIRGYSHINHPCTKWVKESEYNFMWLVLHALELCKEKIYRTGKEHFTYEFIDWCLYNFPNELNKIPSTTPALAFNQYPEYQDYSNPVESYRKYYVNCKRFDKNGKKIDIYTRRARPSWFPEINI